MERSPSPRGKHRREDEDLPELHEPVLSLGCTHTGSTARVVVTGEVDMSNAHLLVEFVVFVCRSSPPLVVLDLSEVDFFGAHGISALLRATELVAASGGQLVVCDPSPFVLRVLVTTGMMRRLRLDLGLERTGNGRAAGPDRTPAARNGHRSDNPPVPASDGNPRRAPVPRQPTNRHFYAGKG